MGSNWVWCGICVKYLAFGTNPTFTVVTLSEYPHTFDITQNTKKKKKKKKVKKKKKIKFLN